MVQELSASPSHPFSPTSFQTPDDAQCRSGAKRSTNVVLPSKLTKNHLSPEPPPFSRLQPKKSKLSYPERLRSGNEGGQLPPRTFPYQFRRRAGTPFSNLVLILFPILSSQPQAEGLKEELFPGQVWEDFRPSLPLLRRRCNSQLPQTSLLANSSRKTNNRKRAVPEPRALATAIWEEHGCRPKSRRWPVVKLRPRCGLGCRL